MVILYKAHERLKKEKKESFTTAILLLLDNIFGNLFLVAIG